MATWTTPTAVHSKCGEEGVSPATNAKDDDTGTYWRHFVTCYHWIILDLGQTYEVSKIRIFQSYSSSVRWGKTDGLDVYVSDDPADFGSAVWGGALNATGWQESGAFSKSGRYVKLVTKSNSQYQRMFEFDAYCAPAITPKTSSDTGVGADASVSLLAAITQSDVGSGTDSLGSRLLSALETGTGTDVVAALIGNILANDTGTGADAVTACINIICKNDVGAGVDTLVSLLAALAQSDTGSGAESLGSRDFSTSDQGAGVDTLSELIATIIKSDSGTGADTLSELIATIIKSDSGTGVETSIKEACIFLLLKLLHERQVNIMASQSDRPVNIALSQEVITS